MKFEDYEKMIMDRAHQVSKSYGADFDDCVGIGYEIYCNALRKFDERKGAKFGTFLYIELNRMVDEIKKERRHNDYDLYEDFAPEGTSYEDVIESSYELPENDILVRAKKVLSWEAYRLLDWILSFSWRDYSKERIPTVPTKKLAIKGCGFPRDVVESAWDECQNFYRLNIA